jgi:hypothetical protein
VTHSVAVAFGLRILVGGILIEIAREGEKEGGMEKGKEGKRAREKSSLCA